MPNGGEAGAAFTAPVAGADPPPVARKRDRSEYDAGLRERSGDEYECDRSPDESSCDAFGPPPWRSRRREGLRERERVDRSASAEDPGAGAGAGLDGESACEDPLALQGEPVGAGTGLTAAAAAMRAVALRSRAPPEPRPPSPASALPERRPAGGCPLQPRSASVVRTAVGEAAAAGGPVLACTAGGAGTGVACFYPPWKAAGGPRPELSLRRPGAGRGVAVACPETLLELRALASRLLGGRVARVEDAAGRPLLRNADLQAVGPSPVLYCCE